MEMSLQLNFESSLNYDAGQPGISIEVLLQLGDGKVSCDAKLDTGSTFCIFARKIGEDLGCQIEGGIKQLVGTVTGTFVVYLHQVVLSVCGFELDALVGFAADDNFQRNALGRRGFMEQLAIGVVDYEGQLYLGRNNRA
ncbi:MAG: hypothetical protein AB7P14_13880 [Blastocatellales bacterium]